MSRVKRRDRRPAGVTLLKKLLWALLLLVSLSVGVYGLVIFSLVSHVLGVILIVAGAVGVATAAIQGGFDL